MKIKFDIKTTYEVDVGCVDDYTEAIDYVTYNAYELVENGEAKSIGESIGDVTEA